MVEVIFLGSGGGMPTPERNLSSLMINYSGRKILVDCGEGTQVSMKIIGRGFKSIDIICITHIHGDHILGLPGLLSTIANSGKIDPMIILGPPGIKKAVNSLLYIVNFLPYEVVIIEATENKLDFTNSDMFKDIGIDFKPLHILVESLELDHSMPCIGYNFIIKRKPKFNIKKAVELNVPKTLWNTLQRGEDVLYNGTLYTSDMVLGENRSGIKVSFITDTRPSENIKEFIKGSDLFICEGTYGKNEDIVKAIKNKHMTFSEAATLALNGNVKKLMLTHFSPALTEPELYLDNAKSVFKESYLASDRLTLNLNFKIK